MDDLEARIIAAERKGDQALLEELQAEYRASVGRGERSVVRVTDATGRLRDDMVRVAYPATSSNHHAGVKTATRSLPRVRTAFMDSGVRQTLQTQAWAAWDGREGGGWLSGHYEGRAVRVWSSSEWRSNERGPYSVDSDLDQAATIERNLPEGKSLVGDWHTHNSQELEPSDADRGAWRRLSQLYAKPWLGIIAGPAPNGYQWSFPRFKAWISTEHQSREIGIEEVPEW